MKTNKMEGRKDIFSMDIFIKLQILSTVS